MSNIEKTVLILLCLFIYSCMNNKKNKNDLYIIEKSKFKTEFIDHFPKEIEDDNTIIFTRFDTMRDKNVTIELTAKITDKNRAQINKHVSNSIGSYSYQDTCLNIVNRFTTLKHRFFKLRKIGLKKKTIINSPCIKENLPIPNFYENKYVLDDLSNKLSSDFNIYVLESKPGIFWDEKYLISGIQMPDVWKHGYSKGLAISEEKSVVIYWFIIW